MKREFFSTTALICLIYLGIVIACSWEIVWYGYKEPVDIYEDGYDFVEAGKGGHIDTTLYVSLGRAASQKKITKSRRGGCTIIYDYYIVPVYDADYNEYYVCVKVSDRKAIYRMLANGTGNYYIEGSVKEPPKGIRFIGTAEKLDDDIYSEVKKWFKNQKWYTDDIDVEKYVLPICLVEKDFDERNKFVMAYAVLGGLSILCFVISKKINLNSTKK